MAFTTGTAQGHNDLLDKLHTYLTVTLSSPWISREFTAAKLEANAVVIVSGGTGYTVSDLLTVVGGTFTTVTTLTVDAVSAGVITAISITTKGVYTVAPGNPVSVTGGTGTGATFTMTYDPSVDTDVATMSVEGPGSGVGKEVFINIQTFNDPGPAEFSWDVFGAIAWQTGIAFGSLPGAGGPGFYNLDNGPINFWFYANDRRFIVIAQVGGTNYMSMYAGFFLPVGLPSEYPFPLALLTSYPEHEKPDLNNARNSSIADPGANGAAWYRRRTDSLWIEIHNQNSSASAHAPSTGQRAYLWPHKAGQGSSGFIDDPDNWNSGGFGQMRLNANSEAPLIQCHIVDFKNNTFVGALEGVFSTTGFSRTVEQTITLGGRTTLLKTSTQWRRSNGIHTYERY